MKGAGGKGMTVTGGSLGRHIPKLNFGARAMKAAAYSQAPTRNRKERRIQAKARKMMGDA